MDSFVDRLRNGGVARVRVDESMARHTSWRVGGRADYLAVVETIPQLIHCVQIAVEQGIPWIVLGGGSNVLVSDEGIEGLVLLNRIKSIQFADSELGPEVCVSSGTFFARLALASARKGYAGLEWGVAIPGTIGAGVVNNAGAHHGDVQRALLRTEVVDASGGCIILTPDTLDFRYRQSSLKRTSGAPITQSQLVVTQAWFRVVRDESGAPMQLLNELVERRTATQPISLPSGGSTFKNPEYRSAGSLIEEAGLKGLRVGGAEFSQKHANFIVNIRGAKAGDVVCLIRMARDRVLTQFDVNLEPEIQLVGRWPDPYPLAI